MDEEGRGSRSGARNDATVSVQKCGGVIRVGRTMIHTGAKVPVYEDVSSAPVSLDDSLRSDLGCDVLDVVLLERGIGDVDHLLAQVDVRDDRLLARIVGVLGE